VRSVPQPVGARSAGAGMMIKGSSMPFSSQTVTLFHKQCQGSYAPNIGPKRQPTTLLSDMAPAATPTTTASPFTGRSRPRKEPSLWTQLQMWGYCTPPRDTRSVTTSARPWRPSWSKKECFAVEMWDSSHLTTKRRKMKHFR